MPSPEAQIQEIDHVSPDDAVELVSESSCQDESQRKIHELFSRRGFDEIIDDERQGYQ